MNFVYLKFERTHFDIYFKWFEEEQTREALYGIDEEWLEYVLKDTTGAEYAVFRDDKMVAVIGIKFPDEENQFCVITNLAVNPELFGNGIGSQVLQDLEAIYKGNENESWVAYVEVKNEKARRFFEKNGWKLNKEMDEDGMLRYFRE